MTRDEQAIRQWFDDWIKATTVGDLPLAESLIDDDAVFLVPGAGLMDKATYAAAATGDPSGYEFELDCSIEEIEVSGDHAWLRASLGLVSKNVSTGKTSKMAGHSLSILRRDGDGWVVVRDANTMVPVEQE